LNPEAEEVKALVEVDHSRLGVREPQAHRRQDCRQILAQRLCVLADTRDRHHEIVRIADKAIGRFTPSARPMALRFGAARPPALGELVVEGRYWLAAARGSHPAECR
jgi:hypothetical protein